MRFVETSKRWDFTRILEELKHYRLIAAGLFFSLIIGIAIYVHFSSLTERVRKEADDYNAYLRALELDPIKTRPPIFHKSIVVYKEKPLYKHERTDYQKQVGEEIVEEQDRVQDEKKHPKTFPPHYFGTDKQGRDVFSRTISGIRNYPIPCLIAVVISTLLGTALGISSTNIQGTTRANTIQRLSQGLMDALEAMPKYITILIAIFLFPNPGFRRIAIILGILNAPKVGKLVSTKIKSLKDRDFIESAYGLGLSPFTVIRRHILRYNCMPLFITQACVQLAEVILIEVALAYIGDISARHKPPLNWPRGVTGDFTLWGNILIEGRWTLSTAWWISLCPLMAIVITVSMCFFLSASINRMVLQQREKIEG